MGRKKVRTRESILSHTIVFRVTAEQHGKLEIIAKASNTRTIAGVVRKILENRPVKLFHKDISMNGPMEELALIRKEIKSIGININQQTHSFHLSTNKTERLFHTLKTADTYKAIEPKIDRLLAIVSKLAEKWLQA